MGTNCCQLKRDKEQELKTGIEGGRQNLDLSGINLEEQFSEELGRFPISSEAVKVQTKGEA